MLDVLQAAAQYFDDADLFGPFIDGHHHRIGNTDCRNQKGDCSDSSEHGLDNGKLTFHAVKIFGVGLHIVAHLPDDTGDTVHIVYVIHF